MIVGLTGGIGSGKSAAANFFVELGVDLIDADDLAKNVLNKNSKGYELFINEFGEQYLDNDKNIDRDLLRKTIFNDSDKKNKLENIIHPQVRSGIEEFIKSSKSDYCIVVVPLIYETRSSSYYDRILVIDCDEEIQINRSAIRDNTENKEIKKIGRAHV